MIISGYMFFLKKKTEKSYKADEWINIIDVESRAIIEKFIWFEKKKKINEHFKRSAISYYYIIEERIIFEDSSKYGFKLVKIKLFNFIGCSLYSVSDNCFDIHVRASRIR